ncbi:putative porin [Flavobacterium sp.]|uniref:putative porin n=1 Tax=Flavobacterium sp. TaxID=239 RepID=UPI00261E835D|nr:putative porin [Flavobacterium sp.]
MTVRILLTALAICMFASAQAQRNTKSLDKLSPGTQTNTRVDTKLGEKSTSLKPNKADITMYQVISPKNDTTYIDTSLTIRKDYIFNYLRKDNFGLLPFANEGQTYNTLDFSLTRQNATPGIGFAGKHFFYKEVEDINYYSVATPLTELYYKTVMEQGHSLDAFITLNTSKRHNFSIAYKGVRSQGKYVNQLTSSGNFRFTASYITKNKRYRLRAHMTAQDLLNYENGGIENIEDFESGDAAFTDRRRLSVYLPDAESILRGNRYYFNQQLVIAGKSDKTNLQISHEFTYEHKFSEYNQQTVNERFGAAYVPSNIRDKVRFNTMKNQVGVSFGNTKIGRIQPYAAFQNFNYFYRSIIVNDNDIIPASLKLEVASVGGNYTLHRNKIIFTADYFEGVTEKTSQLKANITYRPNDRFTFSGSLENLSQIPDFQYNLFQSSFIDYNWSNNFVNQKINRISAFAETPWLNAAFQYNLINDYLYFGGQETTITNGQNSTRVLTVNPEQYGKSISHFSIKVDKEFTFGKFALDNTVLFQQVVQDDDILNVPDLVFRQSFYFSEYLFKRALFLQTGFTVNYFTSYYANNYNPVIGSFYVQNERKIGNFPLVDFFVNARVRQTRIYLKAEHFNSPLTGFNYYSAPDYPYRDFTVRFGLVWNFFQ